MRLHRVIIGYLVLLALFGCNDGAVETVVSTPTTTVTRIARVQGYNVHRIHDLQEKVTCWVIVGSGSSINCIPDVEPTTEEEQIP